MVAFAVSILLTLILVGIFLWYRGLTVMGRPVFACRRPVGTPLTWGEAMAAATFTFFGLFIVYGVVPHEWLSWADNELNWRPDRLVFGPGDILKPQANDGWLPVTITYRTVRDIIAVGIYGAALVGNVVLIVMWQNRGKVSEAADAQASSEYGRPLVKEGAR